MASIVKKTGGGVLIAVSKKYNSYRLSNFESMCEDVWVGVDVRIDNMTVALKICGVYLPSPIQESILTTFINNTCAVLENEGPYIILGDFNLGDITWKASESSQLTYLTGTSNSNSKLNNILLDFISFSNLKQFNCVSNHNDKMLDLVLSDLPLSNLKQCDAPFCGIDLHHPPLQLTLLSDTASSTPSSVAIKRYNFFKADYTSIVNTLNHINWHEKLLNTDNIDDMVNIFYGILQDTIKSHVPMSFSRSNRYPVWFNRDLKRLLKEKNKYRIIYKKYKNPLDKISYNITKQRSIHLIKSCYQSYISLIESSIKSNPKIFWSFIKQKRKFVSSYPSKMSYNNATGASNDEICNLFASCFSSGFDNINTGYVSNNSVTHNLTATLHDIYLSENEVERVLKGLDWRKGAGSDGIPAIFVLRCADVLALPLTLIFNKSLSKGQFPSAWKEALILPLFKDGNRSDVGNYRPISILPIFGKVLESLIYPVIYWHVKPYLIPQQHGFINSRSTATNLACYVTDLVSAVDSRSCADVIYTDFSKAFDKVDHMILISKLSSQFGFHGNVLKWCQSYLANRKFKVVINGQSSDVFDISSGVPQGSHLGPLFFNLFINDVAHCFRHSTFYLYADDLKIVKRVDNILDCTHLQEDIDRFVDWCSDNRMVLNIKKCHFIRFTRKKEPFTYMYKIKNQPLNEVTEIRDLGVHFDKKLTFNVHIDKLVNKCFKMLGFVIRNTKTFKSPHSKILIYNALIRSSLEYCSVIWSPRYEVHIKRVESVQKRFLWHLAFQHKMAKKLPSYNDRLSHYKIQNLQQRRQLLDQYFLHKIIHASFDCSFLLQRINFTILRKHVRSSRFIKPFSSKSFRSNLRHFSPMDRIQSQFGVFAKCSGLDIYSKFSTFKKCLNQALNQSSAQS